MEIEGVQSHLAVADDPDAPLTGEQVARFRQILSELEKRPASELFVDYYHPSRAGHRILAACIVEALIGSKAEGLDNPSR